MKDIFIGGHAFSVEFLRTVSQKEAIENLAHIDKGIVKLAHQKANPKKKSTSKKSAKKD